MTSTSRCRTLSLPISLSALLIGSLVLGGFSCKRPAESPTGGNGSVQAATLPSGLFLEARPDAVHEVAEVKQTANVGDKVTVAGRIGGSRTPFVDGRAMFTLATTSMKTCADIEGDSCETPWDYCCEMREVLLANTLTVQVPGSDGKPLPLSLENVSGLKPMARIVVTGTVSQKTDDQVLVLDAAGIFVEG